jgi:hypothetical protein
MNADEREEARCQSCSALIGGFDSYSIRASDEPAKILPQPDRTAKLAASKLKR